MMDQKSLDNILKLPAVEEEVNPRAIVVRPTCGYKTLLSYKAPSSNADFFFIKLQFAMRSMMQVVKSPTRASSTSMKPEDCAPQNDVERCVCCYLTPT